MKFFSKIKIFCLVFLIIFSIFLCREAKAGISDNVSGWAWSDNIGWISFTNANTALSLVSWNNSTGIMSGYAWSDNIGWVSLNCDDVNVCSTANQFCSVDADCPGGQTCVNTRDGCALISDYKVTINTTTGELSGYAWSDSVGWLSFNREVKLCAGGANQGNSCTVDGNCPASTCVNVVGTPPGSPYSGSETYIAKKVSTKITGWAKFINAYFSGGWDGWVKFACDGTECTTSDYSVYTTGGTNFYGVAWGSNDLNGVVGWLAFASGAVEYGVTINPSTYALSGYAWSENVGWLSFNKADTSTPPAAPFNDGLQTYIAKLDTSTCKLRGWGKFLSAGGGWDGWMKLQREGGTPDYVVSLSGATSEFSGYAWAGSPSESEGVVGWISTNDKDYNGSAGPYDYQITTTLSSVCGPTCSNTSESWSYCTDSRHPVLNWTCSETQTGRQVQVTSLADSGFATPLVDVTDASSSTSYTTSYSFSWNTSYRWRVKCQSASGWSEWETNSDGFTTPLNAYPATDFAWTPQTIRTNDEISFYDDVNYSASHYSKCYNAADAIISCTSWSWTFEGYPANTTLADGDTLTERGTVADPLGVTFKTYPVDTTSTVSVEVRDANSVQENPCGTTNYCCSKSYNITTMRYPKWREIIPW